MDPISLTGRAVDLLQFFLTITAITLEIFRDLIFYLDLYGPAGLFLWIFGNRSIWLLQMEALNPGDEKIAFSLKKLVQEESEIVAVAASIIAQVAITALSLDSLSQVHWTARGSFILSLVSAIMAVYAATTEYRMLCRCANVEDIQGWIKGSYENPLQRTRSVEKQPEDINVPSIASVITVSAPFALLVVALNSFLVGFGIWLGFIWTKNLDPNSTWEDSRAVFITYTIGLGTCYLVYATSTFSSGPRKPLDKGKSDPPTPQAELAPDDQGSWAHGAGMGTAPQPKPPYEELSNALRQTAKLRGDLAESELLLAGLYDRLRRESGVALIHHSV